MRERFVRQEEFKEFKQQVDDQNEKQKAVNVNNRDSIADHDKRISDLENKSYQLDKQFNNLAS